MTDIPSLKISQDNKALLDEANVNKTNASIDAERNFIISEPIDKLNVIGSHFASVHVSNEHLGKDRLTEIIMRETDKLKNEMIDDRSQNRTLRVFSDTNTCDSPKPMNEQIPYFTNFAIVKRTFQTLNNKRSSSFDGIPNIVLKHLPEKICWYYTIIFNNALNHVYFPKKWKKAKVIPIPKKNKDNAIPSNLRPISLLPNISKVFEMIINNSLVNFCNQNDIIPENQFGFRYKHSTIHAINKLTSDICWALNANLRVGACLIDLQCAFDTVWVRGVVFKMMKKNFPKFLIKMVWDMLSGRSFMTSIGGETSTIEFQVRDGLQQGTVNAPIIFNILNSDVLNLFDLNSSSDGTSKASIAFADDLILYVTNKKSKIIQKELQQLYDKTYDYYSTWKQKIKWEKCETIMFRQNMWEMSQYERNHYKNFRIKDKLSGEEIPRKDIVKYLGLNIDHRLRFKQHIDIQLTKAKAAFAKVRRLFFSKHLDKRVKVICYQALIRPILTYGCPIWYNLSAPSMEKLRLFERKCIRACVNMYRSTESDYKKCISNKQIYNTSNIHRIDSHILKLTRSHFAQASKIHENSLIFGNLYPNPMYYERTMKTGYIPPEAFIYLDDKKYLQDDDNIPTIFT